jgi:prepilin-type N-terminal cleavage/methylation domain-containing protein
MKKGGFSITELLVVLAVGALLIGLAVPPMNSVAQAAAVGQAAGIVSDLLDEARQLAQVQGRSVEFRIVKDGEAWNVFQIALSDGTLAGRSVRLPQPAIVCDSDALSPWMGLMNSGTISPPNPHAGKAFRSFRIRPSGAVEPFPSATDRQKLFLTIAAKHFAADHAPTNFVTVQVNPDACRPLVFRP